jgi:hypothetical protein
MDAQRVDLTARAKSRCGGWISPREQKWARRVDLTAVTELSTAGGFHSESKKRAWRADFTAKAEVMRRADFTAETEVSAGGFHRGTTKKDGGHICLLDVSWYLAGEYHRGTLVSVHGYPGCHRNSMVPEIFGIHWASNGFRRIYAPLDSNGLAIEFE